MIIAAMLGALTFGACVDNNESASVEAVRNAKAEELKAQAALLNAEAQAKVILANAEAALKASQAAINQAEAAIKEAQARYQEALAEAKEIENEGALAELQAKIAEYEATIAYQQMLKAQYVAQMEQDAINAEIKLMQVQQNLLDQQLAFNQKLDEVADAEAQELRKLYNAYVKEAGELNNAIASVTYYQNVIAQAEAGIITAEELCEKNIASWTANIADAEAQIAAYQAVLDVYMEAHGDEIISDEELIKLTNEAYVKLAELTEAHQVASDEYFAAVDARNEARTAYDAVISNTNGNAPAQALAAAETAYEAAINALATKAGLKVYSNASDATGIVKAFAWGYYSDDKVSGVNSVFNTVIDGEKRASAYKPTKAELTANQGFKGAYEYALYTINEANLKALVDATKGKVYTEKELKDLADAVEAAKKGLAASEEGLTAAEKAVVDTEAASKKAQADYDAALAALNAAEKAREDAVKAIDDKLAAIDKEWDAARVKVTETQDAYDKVLKDPKATDVDKALALLNLQEAKEANEKLWKAYHEIADNYDALVKAAIQKACSDADYKKLDDANKKAWAARNAAVDAAKAAVVALGEAPEYDVEGNWTYADMAAWLAEQVIDTTKDGKPVYTAHAAVIDAQLALATAEEKLAGAQTGSANFDKVVAEAQAAVAEAAAAYEAAAKAYNEAYAPAVEAWFAANTVCTSTSKAKNAAYTALTKQQTYINELPSKGVSHDECATKIAALESAIAELETNIGRWEAAIANAEPETATLEAQIAAAEILLEQAELKVEVETIYAEAAKAALDAALAEYAQSGETEE